MYSAMATSRLVITSLLAAIVATVFVAPLTGLTEANIGAGQGGQDRMIDPCVMCDPLKAIHGHAIFNDISIRDIPPQIIHNTNVNMLQFSTFLGGSGVEDGAIVATDRNGDIFLGGSTTSIDFPVFNPISRYHQGRSPYDADIFVVKITSNGERVLFGTYIGGSGDDRLFDMSVDENGDVYLVGHTESDDFPLIDAYQRDLRGGGDAFIIKLAAQGDRILFSTLIGGEAGNDTATAISVGSADTIVVGGFTASADFPAVGAVQQRYGGGPSFGDGFLIGVAVDGTVRYSTLIGGSKDDKVSAITDYGSEAVVIVGSTVSVDFRIGHSSPRTVYGVLDGFVCGVDRYDADLRFCRYLGGSDGDEINDVVVGPNGSIFVTGSTYSSNFPVVRPLQSKPAGIPDVFLTELSATSDQVLFSTFLGGGWTDWGYSIASDDMGNVYVSGSTRSKDFPVTWPTQREMRGGSDAFVARVDTLAGKLMYSSYLGGSRGEEQLFVTRGGLAVAERGVVIVTGQTGSTDFPINRALQAKFGGEFDGFVTKLDTRHIPEAVPTSMPSPAPQAGKACDFIIKRVPGVVIAAALANPEGIGGWNNLCNPNLPPSPANGRREWLSLRSIGVPYDVNFNPLVYKCGCP